VTLTPKKEQEWFPATIRVLGTENYELTCLDTKIRFESVPGGFVTKFPGPISVDAKVVMGEQIKHVTIHDVVVDAGFLQLSMASLKQGTYPIVLREGQTFFLVK